MLSKRLSCIKRLFRVKRKSWHYDWKDDASFANRILQQRGFAYQLSLSVPRSTYKFSRLISIHFFWEFGLRSKCSPFGNQLLMLLGENWRWSPLGPKGLYHDNNVMISCKNRCTDQNSPSFSNTIPSFSLSLCFSFFHSSELWENITS